jgi:hypothetical protein
MRALLASWPSSVPGAPESCGSTSRSSHAAARSPGEVPGRRPGRRRRPLGEVGSDANTPVFDFKYLTGFHDTASASWRGR